MKKITGILLVILLIIGTLPMLDTQVNAETNGIYTYEISNGEATITGFNSSLGGTITIPSSLGGCPVTSIRKFAFFKCYHLTNVTIPGSVTSIGDAVFNGCSNLASITIPDSVTYIGGYAFEECYGLTSITIPNRVTSIGNYAFRYCSSLTSITIPSGVTSIGYSAFNGCSSITSITIPGNVTSIGDYAFDACRSLTSITIPQGVTSIGYSAFRYCSSLTSITIPQGVTSIGCGTFSGCKSLTSIKIPGSVTSISDSVFPGCSKLTDVYYTGTQARWDDIQIGSENDCLLNARRHYILGTGVGRYEDTIEIWKNVTADAITLTISPIEGKTVELDGIRLYIAEYSDDGELLSINTVSGTVSDGKLIITADLPSKSVFKMMLRGNAMQPVTKAVSKLQ